MILSFPTKKDKEVETRTVIKRSSLNKQNILMIIDSALKVLRDNNLITQKDLSEVSKDIINRINENEE